MCPNGRIFRGGKRRFNTPETKRVIERADLTRLAPNESLKLRKFATGPLRAAGVAPTA